MSVFAPTPLVGAYVCPRGVFIVECQRVKGGLRITRQRDVPAQLESIADAADQLCRAIRSAGLKRADVTVTLRGFGVVHHVLQMPPAKDEILRPIIEREVRRLEPALRDPIVDWIALPTLDAANGGEEGRRSLLAAALPQQAGQELERRLLGEGCRLVHLTALPASMQRLVEEFHSSTGPSAMAAPLPDGAFVGFALNGGLRLIVEPPLPQEGEHEAAALAEEVELGVIFVRQQFRGAQVERVTLVGASSALLDAESVLRDRLNVPVAKLAMQDLAPAGLAAVGGLLDRQSPKPLSLGGVTRQLQRTRTRSSLETAALFATALVAALGAWSATEIVRTERAKHAVELARRRIQQDSFGLAPIRATADQRKLVRDATVAYSLVANDRMRLQDALAGVAAALRPPLHLDSLHLMRGPARWKATLVGSVTGVTNARAVQSLNELYYDLPQQVRLDSLRLDQLAYGESATTDGSAPAQVRFQLTFNIPLPKKN